LKNRVENPKEPLQFYLPNEEGKMVAQSVYACGECRCLIPGHHTKEEAAKCCKIQRCKDCKKELKLSYACDQCFDCACAERESKKVYTDVEYVDGPLCELNGDRYFQDMDELLDHYANEEADERPEFFHPCDKVRWSGIGKNVIGDALESETEDLFEDAEDHMTPTTEINEAIEKWNKEQNITYWVARQNERITVDYAGLDE
jgi:hypothetical protein